MRRRHLSFLLLVVVLVALGAPATAAGDPARGRQWNLDIIGADAARAVANGSGITVAVVDSGVDLHHEDLQGQLVPGHDFVEDDDDPQDAYGHGTHVAGIIAAVAGNSKGIAGVAPGAKVMPVRVLGPDGSGTLDDVVAGVRWAVQHGAKVINLSLGEDTQALLGPAFGDVLREAWAAGAVPVVSAGNQILTGSGFRNEPALVVAATDRQDLKPTYSSGVGAAQWGISAPGGELPDLGPEGAILSTYWTGKEPNQYAYLAGTSQAAPHVAAAVAILLSTGRFTPTQAVHRLLDTAKDVGAPGHDATFGAGRLDLAAATAGLGPAQHGRPATGSPAPVRPRPRAASPTTSTTTTTIVIGAPAVTAPSTIPPPIGDQTPETLPRRRVTFAAGRGEGGDGSSRTAPATVAFLLAAGVTVAGIRQRRAGP